MLAAKTKASLRLRITAAAESAIRSGHPWIFAESIRQQNRAGELGELAVIFDRQDQFLAIGLFDPESPLRVRVLHAGKPQMIDLDWWRANLQESILRRDGLFDANTTGYRLVHGESDGWPGLVLDRYGTTLVLKLYTAAWLPRLQEMARLIAEMIDQERLVLRLSRNIQSITREQFHYRDGAILQGSPLAEPVVFQESGLRFEADVLHGQKTGFFLDQRENRRNVERLAPGRDVLNVFSFSGGFSLYAARGGARSVTDLDISAHALASARRNFELNQHELPTAFFRHETVRAEAFEWLAAGAERMFDLIVLDPPSLARKQSERIKALQAYRRLIEPALKRLRKNGVLVAASCSAHIATAEFFDIVRRSALRSKRTHQELKTTGHPPDHPATFQEAEYLKCIYLQF
jgi:23S rRNA (cytosine1962-C5)-methyltransferase